MILFKIRLQTLDLLTAHQRSSKKHCIVKNKEQCGTHSRPTGRSNRIAECAVILRGPQRFPARFSSFGGHSSRVMRPATSDGTFELLFVNKFTNCRRPLAGNVFAVCRYLVPRKIILHRIV